LRRTPLWTGRPRNGRGVGLRAVWLLGGPVQCGMGIWSMHYIGMLAFILPISRWPTTADRFSVTVCGFLASESPLGVVEPAENGLDPVRSPQVF